MYSANVFHCFVMSKLEQRYTKLHFHSTKHISSRMTQTFQVFWHKTKHILTFWTYVMDWYLFDLFFYVKFLFNPCHDTLKWILCPKSIYPYTWSTSPLIHFLKTRFLSLSPPPLSLFKNYQKCELKGMLQVVSYLLP